MPTSFRAGIAGATGLLAVPVRGLEQGNLSSNAGESINSTKRRAAMIQLLHGDCLDMLDQVEDGSSLGLKRMTTILRWPRSV
jgi:hypothetical protein